MLGPQEGDFVEIGQLGVRFPVGRRGPHRGTGELVFKPRGIWHAFWNAGDEPARLLEIISPAGFERYFVELAPLLPPAAPEPDVERIAALRTRYGLKMDMGSIDRLVAEHGLAPRGG